MIDIKEYLSCIHSFLLHCLRLKPQQGGLGKHPTPPCPAQQGAHPEPERRFWSLRAKAAAVSVFPQAGAEDPWHLGKAPLPVPAQPLLTAMQSCLWLLGHLGNTGLSPPQLSKANCNFPACIQHTGRQISKNQKGEKASTQYSIQMQYKK